jgi:hypothetical protein
MIALLLSLSATSVEAGVERSTVGVETSLLLLLEPVVRTVNRGCGRVSSSASVVVEGGVVGKIVELVFLLLLLIVVLLGWIAGDMEVGRCGSGMGSGHGSGGAADATSTETSQKRSAGIGCLCRSHE